VLELMLNLNLLVH